MRKSNFLNMASRGIIAEVDRRRIAAQQAEAALQPEPEPQMREATLAEYIRHMDRYEGEANSLNLMNGLLMDILEASSAGTYSSEIICNYEQDEGDGSYSFDIYPLQSNMVSEDGEDIEISSAEEIHIRHIKHRIGHFLNELEGCILDRSVKIDPDNGVICFQRKIDFFNVLRSYLEAEGTPILDINKMNLKGVIKNEPSLEGLNRRDQLRILFSQKAAVAMYQIELDQEHEDDENYESHEERLLYNSFNTCFTSFENYLGASQISLENMPHQLITINLHLAVLEEKIRLEDNMDRDYEVYASNEGVFLEKRKCNLKPTLN